nr:hypothetical protein CFP56_67626 [Quercus suber]
MKGSASRRMARASRMTAALYCRMPDDFDTAPLTPQLPALHITPSTEPFFFNVIGKIRLDSRALTVDYATSHGRSKPRATTQVFERGLTVATLRIDYLRAIASLVD